MSYQSQGSGYRSREQINEELQRLHDDEAKQPWNLREKLKLVGIVVDLLLIVALWALIFAAPDLGCSVRVSVAGGETTSKLSQGPENPRAL